MAIEEVHTLVDYYFGDGCNMEIFWAKLILLVIRYIFGQAISDGDSYQFGHYNIPLRFQVMKHKTRYLIFGMTDPQVILVRPETIKGVKWVQITFILIQCLKLKPPMVHNFEVIVVLPFWVVLRLYFPIPTTGLLSEIYHRPIMEVIVSRSIFFICHQV